jgi:hypothetical protein
LRRKETKSRDWQKEFGPTIERDGRPGLDEIMACIHELGYMNRKDYDTILPATILRLENNMTMMTGQRYLIIVRMTLSCMRQGSKRN